MRRDLSSSAPGGEGALRLPAFSVDEYLELLRHLSAAGFSLQTVTRMRESTAEKTAYIRHDIDLHVKGAEAMATAEADAGVRATYYVLLTQHYNLLEAENRRSLRRLADLHEIGLHYDLETYPTDPVAARERLEWEIGVLEELSGRHVRTVSMHQPYKGLPDPFLSLDDYVHPHDPRFQQGLTYVSDSCRAWRDTALLECCAVGGPRRLLLNTHPELWLDGSVTDRMRYLEEVLLEQATRQQREFIENTIRDAWLSHPGPRLHDERERRRSGVGTEARVAGAAHEGEVRGS